MDQKTQLTKSLLDQMGIASDPKSLKKWYTLWWQNPRSNGIHSMRLTDRGLEDFEIKAELKSYKIDFPEPLEIITNQFILDLEKYIDGPYYISRRYIKVFTEKVAVQLVLFGGNLQKFNRARTMSRKNNTDST